LEETERHETTKTTCSFRSPFLGGSQRASTPTPSDNAGSIESTNVNPILQQKILLSKLGANKQALAANQLKIVNIISPRTKDSYKAGARDLGIQTAMNTSFGRRDDLRKQSVYNIGHQRSQKEQASPRSYQSSTSFAQAKHLSSQNV
tara:strand:+ start:525 stop:965 length:441 start_codon:yes stop_codon:yes gene_type:complete